MNPNNDDNTKVGDNYYFDDTHNSPSKYTDDCGNNNISSFYFWWKQVQVWVLDDGHNDVIVDHTSTYNVMSGKRNYKLHNDAENCLSCVLLRL